MGAVAGIGECFDVGFHKGREPRYLLYAADRAGVALAR